MGTALFRANALAARLFFLDREHRDVDFAVLGAADAHAHITVHLHLGSSQDPFVVERSFDAKTECHPEPVGLLLLRLGLLFSDHLELPKLLVGFRLQRRFEGITRRGKFLADDGEAEVHFRDADLDGLLFTEGVDGFAGDELVARQEDGQPVDAALDAGDDALVALVKPRALEERFDFASGVASVNERSKGELLLAVLGRGFAGSRVHRCS